MENKIIPYARQCVDQTDVDAVTDVLHGDWLTQGPTIDKFEKALVDYCGAKYAIAVSSGTAALYIAVKLCNAYAKVGITTPNTFVATANAFEYNNMRTMFVDIDRYSWNIDVNLIKSYVDYNTRIFIPVHFAGLPCNMEYVAWLKNEFGFIVIEDASHALGATFNGDKIGSCKYSDMTIFSFHPVKHITTLGEGGAILTNNKDFAERAKALRTHGITKANYHHAPWYYEMNELGLHARITDAQCAMGLSQLEKLDSFLKRRREIAHKYKDAFVGLFGIRMQNWNYDAEHAYHLFVVHLDNTIYNRLTVYNKMRERGICCQVHYIPVNIQPYYIKKYNMENQCPVANNYYGGCLSLPMYPAMTNEDVDRVIKSFKEVLYEHRNQNRWIE